MADLISRQAAIALMCRALHHNYEEGYAVTQMLELPSTQQWIPVSERLPKANEKERGGVRRYYLVQNEYGDMMVASWNGVFWEQMYRYKPVEDEVVAWMPLPEPLEGGDDA